MITGEHCALPVINEVESWRLLNSRGSRVRGQTERKISHKHRTLSSRPRRSSNKIGAEAWFFFLLLGRRGGWCGPVRALVPGEIHIHRVEQNISFWVRRRCLTLCNPMTSLEKNPRLLLRSLGAPVVLLAAASLLIGCMLSTATWFALSTSTCDHLAQHDASHSFMEHKATCPKARPPMARGSWLEEGVPNVTAPHAHHAAAAVFHAFGPKCVVGCDAPLHHQHFLQRSAAEKPPPSWIIVVEVENIVTAAKPSSEPLSLSKPPCPSSPTAPSSPLTQVRMGMDIELILLILCSGFGAAYLTAVCCHATHRVWVVQALARKDLGRLGHATPVPRVVPPAGRRCVTAAPSPVALL